jgi:hypothetical protein
MCEYLGWEDDARAVWFRDLSLIRIGVSSVLRFYGFEMAYGVVLPKLPELAGSEDRRWRRDMM